MTDLINAGLELMLVGMGIVYVFLAMLVVAVNLMSRVLRRYFPEVPDAPRVSVAAPAPNATIAAAIGAALHRYRATHKQ